MNDTDRQRRSYALWRAGRDGSIPIVVRSVARCVSAYERAPVRDLMTASVLAVVEGAVTSIVVRAMLRLTGAPLPDGTGDLPPESGWRGTGLALAMWILPFVVVGVAVRW